MSDSEQSQATVEFRVAESEAGERIDKVVARHTGAIGRRAVAELFERGAVRVDGKRAKKGDRARSGNEVSVAGSSAAISAEPDAPLDVLLETPSVVIVSKPAGQPTAPIRLGETGSLAAALLGRYPEIAGIGYRAREPGLLHRLDTQTSGLVVTARNSAVFEHLREQLSLGFIDKRYLAIVEDRSDLGLEGTIDRGLGPDPGDSRRVIIAPPEAARPRRAVTRWRVVRRVGSWALLEVEARHAYRHQVRVHLASEGHPIVGDSLYGGPAAPSLGARHALHASYVAWAGDAVVPAFVATDPLPTDLEALVGAD